MTRRTQYFGTRYYPEERTFLNWISLDYFRVYGTNTRRFEKWKLCHVVAIQTDKGLWRFNSQGYTSRFGEAQYYLFSEAYDTVKSLGPEKQTIFIEFPLELLTKRILETKDA